MRVLVGGEWRRGRLLNGRVWVQGRAGWLLAPRGARVLTRVV